MQFDSQQLIKVRVAKKISQEALATTVGVSRVTVASWETGKTEPSIDKLNKMANALSVPAALFLVEG